MTEVLSRNFIFGKKLGYFLGYGMFSSALYLVLNFLEKLPSSITPIKFFMITLVGVMFGTIIMRILK